ncbi:RDD family protein [Williamsia sp. CHRR-6]|uniref:RDD family protein n=1 Tax=Williamsia sp. CHRR-6 TaxID=2835871 RepID=UPI001BD940FE|nr:RDD family protein [Williamsia sp. CHRR-6]MBT0565732.1 RDD family protein [Williamsia sp. CHRR-6]
MHVTGDFTTGEAVDVRIPIARVGTRAIAQFVDGFLQMVGFLGALAVLVALSLDPALEAALAIVVFVAVFVGYPLVFETVTRGRTVGKFALGLQVVRDDGGPIGLREAAIRALCAVVVDIWIFGAFGVVATITSLSSDRGRRIGDALAGTTVVALDRSIGVAPRRFPPHPILHPWAMSLALDVLDAQLCSDLRTYLLRLPDLSPPAQYELGTALTHALQRSLRVPMPTGYPPAEVVGAILAARAEQAIIDSHRV